MVEQQSTYTDDIDVSQPVTIQGVEEEVEQVLISIATPIQFKRNFTVISKFLKNRSLGSFRKYLKNLKLSEKLTKIEMQIFINR